MNRHVRRSLRGDMQYCEHILVLQTIQGKRGLDTELSLINTKDGGHIHHLRLTTIVG